MTEKDVHIGGSAASSTSGWAGWAVSGMTSLTSKIYRGRGQRPPAAIKPVPGGSSLWKRSEVL